MSTDGDRWELRRNCRMRPRQLALWCALPCGISLLIGTAFTLLGYPMFLAFAGLETLAVVVAFLIYARHAADRATVTLRDGELQIEELRGARLRITRLQAAWLTVKAEGSALKLSCRGTTVQLQGYATGPVCASLERDLRRALREHRPTL